MKIQIIYNNTKIDSNSHYMNLNTSIVQLFAKILHNGSESGSMTLANQTHVGVTN